MNDFDALRASIKSILENPFERKWSTQGFGMMRTYLDKDKEWRLNIWHQSLAVPNVSTIHDHPWNFNSWVIAGEFVNQRFAEDLKGQEYQFMKIKTGEGGGPTGAVHYSRLLATPKERYLSGDRYQQKWDEIHETKYSDGAVTLNQRTRVGTGEHARVFWEKGAWVDAEPRPSTDEEIHSVISCALKNFQ